MKDQKHALIIANGEFPLPAQIKSLCAEADLVIAADGAANKLAMLRITPHVVIGDFDSLNPVVRLRMPKAEFVSDAGQETSDLEKAISYARSRGAGMIAVLGFSGGRVDHVLAALSTMVKYHREAEIRFVHNNTVVRAVIDSAEIHGQPGDTISISAFAPATDVTTEGLEWALAGECIEPGSRGVSNRLTNGVARITVGSGVLLVTHISGDADTPGALISLSMPILRSRNP